MEPKKRSKQEMARRCFAIFLWILVAFSLFLLLCYKTCPQIWRHYWPNYYLIIRAAIRMDFCGNQMVFYGAGLAALLLGLAVFIIRRK